MQEYELSEVERIMSYLRKFLDASPFRVDNATVVDAEGKIIGIVRWREGDGNGGYDFEPHVEQPPLPDYLR